VLPFLTRSAGPGGPTHERVAYQTTVLRASWGGEGDAEAGEGAAAGDEGAAPAGNPSCILQSAAYSVLGELADVPLGVGWTGQPTERNMRPDGIATTKSPKTAGRNPSDTRQDLRPILRDGDRVLEMGRQ
jgi:hypothetical protein